MEQNLNDISNSSKSSKNTNSDESESNQKEENIKNGELKEIPIKLSSKIELNKKAENLDSKAKTDDDEVKDNKEINIVHGTNESIIFDNKEFKIYNRANKYQKKDEIKRIIYKCKNHRKDEKIRSEMGLKSFCNATIEYIIPNQKIKSSYILTKDHTSECYNLKIDLQNNDFKILKDKEKFINFCEEIMNNSNIYDRKLFKNKFKNIYNENKFNFPIDNNMLSNIINKWKNHSTKMNKFISLVETKDYKGRLIFRDFRSTLVYIETKKNPILIEYIIWGNDENIGRMRNAKNYYIDGTFHHPIDFKQLLIVMCMDLITKINIPALYILMNGKTEKHYDLVFESIYNIITQYRAIDIEIETIITDTEPALINIVKKFFPNSKRIACFFHYKQDLIRNIRLYCLYKKDQKK